MTSYKTVFSLHSLCKAMLPAIMFCTLGSCKKYLDEKPDKSQVIPASLRDCQALLNNVAIITNGFPQPLEIAADDYYLTTEAWNSLSQSDRDTYVWDANANLNSINWADAYKKVLLANQVLETLGNINPTVAEQAQWNQVKGSALLLRGIAFYTVAQLFCVPYDAATANRDPGVPIRLTPSLSEGTARGTVQQTYDRVIADFTEAASLLPAQQPLTPTTKSTSAPVKAAAWAALARVCLSMGNYAGAWQNADASLQAYSALIDYKTISPAASYPFPDFNTEALYYFVGYGGIPLFTGAINPDLYNAYAANDLRKAIYFKVQPDGTYRFNGAYQIYNGMATDEMYLVRAECAARQNNKDAALTDLNILLRNRYDNSFVPLTAANAADALKLVVQERRKELLFRGLRWTDLRRLNKEPQFAVTLKRTLDNKEYTLSPNDLRYTWLIPREVLDRASMPQNQR